MLKHRLTLGPLLIAGLIGVIWLDELVRSRWDAPGLVFGALVLLVGVLAGRELSAVFRARGFVVTSSVTALAIALGVIVASLTPPEHDGFSGTSIVASASGLVLFVSMMFYSRNQSAEGVIASVSVTLLAFVYVGLLGGFLVVVLKQYTGWVLLGVLLVTKSCDIGAYFTGTSIGRHKLIPWLSPGKTWEGLIGGLLTAALLGAALAPLTSRQGIPIDLAWWQGALLGAAFGLVGQSGDLVASMLKRDAGVKDYAQTLPGFGGVMDVADSPLLVAPVAYWLLALVSSSPAIGAGASIP